MSCHLFSPSNNFCKLYATHKNRNITESNLKNVLDNYYVTEQLKKENASFWSSSQDFNINNYLMSALMINISYLCCGTNLVIEQQCDDNNLNKTIKIAGIKDHNKIISNYSVIFGLVQERAWFATIGLIEGTDLGIIAWRGTKSTNDWLADASPGFQDMFKTCKSETIELGNKCNRISNGDFKKYEKNNNKTYIPNINNRPMVHGLILDIYNNSYVTSGKTYYTVYGAVKNLYPSTTKWIITGHSLGAALAELTSADLSSRGVKINSVYMFADPSPGNNIYRDIYNNLNDNYNGKKLENIGYNIKNINDIVPNFAKYYEFGRHLVGDVKKFKGPGSKTSPSKISLAHTMCESYIIAGIGEFFGKNANLTEYIPSTQESKSGVSKNSSKNSSKMLYISIFIIFIVILICGVVFMIMKK